MALEPSEFSKSLEDLYRQFFNQAERRRRWSLENDIPWEQCNKALDPAVADVVESFCAVELYLPDYLSKLMRLARPSRGQAWFYANWGYEESKHSIALGDWLLKSGMRSESQLTEIQSLVVEHEWNLPHDSAMGMVAYAMVQERATALNYRNLRRQVEDRDGDPALDRLLTLIAVDEQAHHKFFQNCMRLYLARDRAAAIEQLRVVMNNFLMPAIYLLADNRQRIARIKELHVFDDDIYFREVYLPILAELGIDRSELRGARKLKKSDRTVAEQTMPTSGLVEFAN